MEGETSRDALFKNSKEILKPRIGQSLNNKIKKIKEKVFLNSKKIRKSSNGRIFKKYLSKLLVITK